MSPCGAVNASSALYTQLVDSYWQCNGNSVAGGSGVQVGTAVSGHRGIARITTGASAGNIYALYHAGTPNAGQVPSSGCINLSDIVRVDFWIKLGGIADSRIVVVGLGVDCLSSSFGANSVYFTYDSASNANWQTVTRASSVSTTNVTTVAANSTAWVKLSIERCFPSNSSTTGYLFLINDDPLTFHTTNLPTVTNANCAVEVNTQSAANKSVDIDRIDIYVTEDHLIG